MIVEELKKSILQLASEGKLVNQDYNYSAKKELETILLDSKDNKKYEYKELYEVPFDIPSNWIWVKLEDICNKITDGTHSTPKYTTAGIPFISVKDVSSGYINFDNTKYISLNEHKRLYERCNPEYGDILITKVGTTGVPAIVETTDEFSLFVSVALLKININKINNKYLYYFLNTPIVQKQVKDNTRGVGNKNWVLDAIKSTVLPLPPIEEQQRIVIKIEELFEKLDVIKPIEEELRKLKLSFPNDMKNSILSSAFKGKLTQRLESDSSTKKLITEILNIKEDLIKNKRVKNDIYVNKKENLEIPNEWGKLYLGEIGDWGSGSTPSRSHPEYYNGTISWLKTGELLDGYTIDSEEKITEEALKKGSFKINKKGDILIAMYGATIGKLAIASQDTTTNQACCGCSIYGNKIYNKYLFYYLLSIRKKLIKMGVGSGQPNISREKIINLTIPIPSIEEQKRIVEVIEQLLPLCDDIEKLVVEVGT